MKKIITLILGVALAFSMHSCQQADVDNNQSIEKKLKITAVIDRRIETRVSYNVDNEANTITPAWEANDEVFGFDSNGDTFTLKIAAPGEGATEATLEIVTEGYEPAEGTTLYAIFAPGYSVDNLSGNTLSVDLASQGGVLDASTPALMCATGTVEANGDNNELKLHFANQTAIIGVKKFQLSGSTQAHTVTSMTINGVITTGTFQVNEGVLELVPGTETGSITASNATGWTTDEKGICSAGVYFAAMPTETAPEITLNASDGSTTFSNVSAVAATSIEPGMYYFMSKKFGADAVARIGETLFATIDEAWGVANAASEAVTVTLLADCAASAQLKLNSSGAGDVTIDLNGFNLSTAYQIIVSDGRALSVTDNSSAVLASQGAITSSFSGGAALYVDASTLNFSGGTLSNPGLAKYPLYITGASTAAISGGKIYASNYSAAYVDSDATVTISGGELLSENRYGIYTCGTLTVSGGSVMTNASNSDYRTFYNTGGGQLKITGGTFASNAAPVITSNQSTSKALVTGGYFSKQDPTGELFTINNSGKCYISAAYTDRPVNSNRSLSDNGTYVRCNRPNPTAATKAAYPFQVGNYDRYWNTKLSYGSNNYTYWFSTLVGAALHASKVLVDITIEPRSNQASISSASMANTSGKTITIDVKGKSLGSTAASLLSLGGKVVITDTGSPKGKIYSSKSKVIDITTAGADVTLNGVVIESTKETGDGWGSDAVVNIDNSTASLTITDSRIYSTKKLSVLRAYKGTVTINGTSELSSGTESEGWYVIMSNSTGTVTVNSGSFYTSGTGLASTCHVGSSGAHINVNGGYFYSEGRAVSGGSKSYFLNITLNGGYYNKMPTAPTSDTGSDEPSYGEGLSMQEIDPVETHEHVTTGVTYNYGYQVKATTP